VIVVFFPYAPLARRYLFSQLKQRGVDTDAIW